MSHRLGELAEIGKVYDIRHNLSLGGLSLIVYGAYCYSYPLTRWYSSTRNLKSALCSALQHDTQDFAFV